MTDLIKRDPFRSLFAWPRWSDDFEEASMQRGLKLKEDAKNIYIEAVVAGVPPESVDVNIEDGVVTIKAESKEASGPEGLKPGGKNVEKQFRYSSYSYYYTCALSGGKWDKAEAEVKHGVVTITVPKEEAARPRKVKVKTTSK